MCSSRQMTNAGTEVDHCFSRDVMQLHFDVRNLTMICRSHHQEKTFTSNEKVFYVVKRREGVKWFEWARAIALSKKPGSPNILELEQIEVELKRKINNRLIENGLEAKYD